MSILIYCEKYAIIRSVKMFEPLLEAGYERRRSQEEMAGKIVKLMREGGIYMLEAPTGTGKTFAYLIPVILSGKRVLVSTYSRLLQEQLLEDIRKISDIYRIPVSAGVWKGVSSYVCKVKLEEENDEELKRLSEEKGGDIFKISFCGDRIREYTVEDAEECNGCTREDCYYRRAKAFALSSDVTVVNHHILAKFPSLFSGYDLVVIDEGHEFPEVLVEAQTLSFSEKTIKEYINTDVCEKDLPGILELLKGISVHLKLHSREEIDELLSSFRGETITSATLSGIRRYVDYEPRDVTVKEGYSVLDRKIWKILNRVRRLEELMEKIKVYSAGAEGYERIVEEGRWKTFKMVPLFADFKTFLGRSDVPVAFVSATLDRDYMEMMLGLEEGDYEYFTFPQEWEYNFEIEVVDVHPDDRDWEYALIYAINSAGREYEKVIVLLTNREHLNFVDTPLKQNCAGLKDLIDRFRKEGGILAGTDTFWKGIDVPGKKAIVIGRIPFKNPEDRIHAKRCEFLRSYYGKEEMWRYIKGIAKINLKQGIGRLKRRKEDTGKVYIVDNRVFKDFFGDFLSLLSYYGEVKKTEVSAWKRVFTK